MNAHDIMRFLLDKGFGEGTYARLHMDDPNPRVQAAIRRAAESKTDGTKKTPPR